MINEKQARLFCGEPIENIENYEKAVSDKTKTWHCHHIWETMLGYSAKELKEMDEYYGIPAQNLIFLTPSEHRRVHNNGELNNFYGKHHTEENKMKISKANKNGVLSKIVLQYTLEGEFVKEWPSTMEIKRQLGIEPTNISACCLGKIRKTHGFIWKYKR